LLTAPANIRFSRGGAQPSSFQGALLDTVFVEAPATSVVRAGANTVKVTAFAPSDVSQAATNSTVTWEARDAGERGRRVLCGHAGQSGS
jgi:hypothetical protein